jgi:hypothetical protein
MIFGLSISLLTLETITPVVFALVVAETWVEAVLVMVPDS